MHLLTINTKFMNKITNRFCLFLAAFGLFAGSVAAYADASSASVLAE